MIKKILFVGLIVLVVLYFLGCQQSKMTTAGETPSEEKLPEEKIMDEGLSELDELDTLEKELKDDLGFDELEDLELE